MANANLAQTIKQQILVRLQALKAAGAISSIAELEEQANPLKIEPDNGYPLAVCAMPEVTSDYADQANNLRVYVFNILVVMNPQTMTANAGEAVEVLMDKVLGQFDDLTNITLAGAAQAAVLPMEIQGFPVSTADKTWLCFVATIRARTLYQIS